MTSRRNTKSRRREGAAARRRSRKTTRADRRACSSKESVGRRAAVCAGVARLAARVRVSPSRRQGAEALRRGALRDESGTPRVLLLAHTPFFFVLAGNETVCLVHRVCIFGVTQAQSSAPQALRATGNVCTLTCTHTAPIGPRTYTESPVCVRPPREKVQTYIINRNDGSTWRLSREPKHMASGGKR